MSQYIFQDLLSPKGLVLPKSYVDLIEGRSLPDIDPWRFLAESRDLSIYYYEDMRKRFSQAPLIPFAWINDQSGEYNEGWVVLACFEASPQSVSNCVRIYDYGVPKVSPWQNLSYASFEEWLAAAKVESARFKDGEN
jgi:hypothetical protein